jgi:hypothetical protein
MMDSNHGFFLFPSRRELLLFEGGGTFSSAMIIACQWEDISLT